MSHVEKTISDMGKTTSDLFYPLTIILKPAFYKEKVGWLLCCKIVFYEVVYLPRSFGKPVAQYHE